MTFSGIKTLPFITVSENSDLTFNLKIDAEKVLKEHAGKHMLTVILGDAKNLIGSSYSTVLTITYEDLTVMEEELEEEEEEEEEEETATSAEEKAELEKEAEAIEKEIEEDEEEVEREVEGEIEESGEEDGLTDEEIELAIIEAEVEQQKETIESLVQTAEVI